MLLLHLATVEPARLVAVERQVVDAVSPHAALAVTYPAIADGHVGALRGQPDGVPAVADKKAGIHQGVVRKHDHQSIAAPVVALEREVPEGDPQIRPPRTDHPGDLEQRLAVRVGVDQHAAAPLTDDGKVLALHQLLGHRPVDHVFAGGDEDCAAVFWQGIERGLQPADVGDVDGTAAATR